MASTSIPDIPITLKINHDGRNCRFKLPLRDLGVNTLEGKLRNLLQIPQGVNPTFERYSDSAASYVVLDKSNISVYKQLYRAAKAKQKLKLRVTSQSEPRAQSDEVTEPKPVTVEDVPEFAEAKDGQTSAPADSPISNVILTVTAPQILEDFPIFVEQWLELGLPRIHLRRNSEGVEVVDFYNSQPESNIEETNIPMPSDFQFSKAASRVSFVSLVRQAQDKRKLETSPEPTETVESIKLEKEKELSNSSSTSRPFTVCCNSCDKAVPDAHFHCSTCDDGDFDLCQDCINKGITCYDEAHWMIKRTVKDGQITYSTTHLVPKINRALDLSKSTGKPLEKEPTDLPARLSTQQPVQIPLHNMIKTEGVAPIADWRCFGSRTCNSCVLELPEHMFLHCTSCEDYDLCQLCFMNDQHGHHPKHGFEPAIKNTMLLRGITTRLGPGRNVAHNAICDGCDDYIRGVRHKCLDCPDWDYCAKCVLNADFIHKGHRFVPIYEPIAPATRTPGSPSQAVSVHAGICCDGPLCVPSRRSTSYIIGVRYKCAVCHDTDFCANCEASPANKHNKTHPLIKFKTPVRHVSVSTSGEHENGQRLPPMGDRCTRPRTSHRATETTPSPKMSVNSVQTVVDVKPSEAETSGCAGIVKMEEIEIKKESGPVEKKLLNADDLVAVFQHDLVPDGTVLPPNHTFEQTWLLSNDGEVAWPAGCSVKFVGGDYMGAIDPNHPAGVGELTSASESNVLSEPVAPGQSTPFTVQMRTPCRSGKVISYWRLTTPEGIKFGHRLWCDVNVVENKPIEEPQEEKAAPELVRSQMIIPKLEHESPKASIYETKEDTVTETRTETEAATIAPSTHETDVGEFEDCGVDEDWAEESDEGFMTDEEYDILDASDEEYLFDQQQKASSK